MYHKNDPKLFENPENEINRVNIFCYVVIQSILTIIYISLGLNEKINDLISIEWKEGEKL